MSAPHTLLQAAMQRLAARMGSAVADTAAGLAVLAQDAPARLQQELTLFWQEVELEAERLERGESTAASPDAERPSHRQGEPAADDPQEQIDRLRAQVAALARRLESPTP
jgi:phage I-like protein